MDKPTSLADQGRRLSQLQQQILAIRTDAAERARNDRQHAAAFQAQAEEQVAPLLAEALALRDSVIARARRRAQWSWSVVYAGIALIIGLALWQLLR